MTSRKCSAHGCDAAHRAKGWCLTHYTRERRLKPRCKATDCKAGRVKAGYCRPHERLALSRRTTAAQAKTLDSFRQLITVDPATGCWLFSAATLNPDGYGQMWVGQSYWLAHRFAYVWFNGGHARGKVLDHVCIRPNCVRPDHMEPVTNRENTRRRDSRRHAASNGYAWFWSHGTDYSPAMEEWAHAVDLPYSKPTHADFLHYAASLPAPNP